MYRRVYLVIDDYMKTKHDAVKPPIQAGQLNTEKSRILKFPSHCCCFYINIGYFNRNLLLVTTPLCSLLTQCLTHWPNGWLSGSLRTFFFCQSQLITPAVLHLIALLFYNCSCTTLLLQIKPDHFI